MNKQNISKSEVQLIFYFFFLLIYFIFQYLSLDETNYLVYSILCWLVGLYFLIIAGINANKEYDNILEKLNLLKKND